MLSSVKGYCYSGSNHLDFNTQYNCGEFVVYIHDSDLVNIDRIFLDLTISSIDSSATIDITPGAINTSSGYPVYSYTHIRYTDTAFFRYLGAVILDSANAAQSTYHAYRFVFKNYSTVNNTITFFNLKTDLSLGIVDPVYKWANYYYKNCGACNRYPSRLELSLFISDIFWNDPANEYGMIDLSLYAGYSTVYASLSSSKKSTVTTLLNWLLNYNVTASDYSTAYSTTTDSLAMPWLFYASGNANQVLDCPCKSEMLNLLHVVSAYLLTNGTGTPQINYIKRYLNYYTYFGCGCPGGYYYFVTRKEQVITIKCEPIYSGLPYMVYVIDVSTGLNELAYSYAFDDNSGAYSWPFIPSNPLIYNTSTHAFTLAPGFSSFNKTTDFQAVCELPCKDCIESFAPVPGKKYLVSGWVKEDGAPLAKTAYTFPGIVISCPSAAYTSPTFTATGAIIDGWQRVEGEFIIPAAATDLAIQLECSSGDCYFDDIRVLPFDGSMKSYVYDNISMRLVAELDERNYATLYEYDEQGMLVRVKKETEKGIMTIKENRNNTKK